ncbi:hypothetical protein CPB84DRAFT_936458 [Gymnopilus junonius]|uniref:Uncharacterized protein n=1 Tax=Gymnopilus junonius TaxID=109634 RepID=A0A9P5TSP6_GYMJU|nr:hypothetical protein CPB84DRAFT_936458 [Gymnopilus junonius]
MSHTRFEPLLEQETRRTRKTMAPALRKTLSAPRMVAESFTDTPVFPKELQEQAALMKRKQAEPERWMCFVRREKINFAVGRLVVLEVKNNKVGDRPHVLSSDAARDI